jgi:hypothetical protein
MDNEEDVRRVPNIKIIKYSPEFSKKMGMSGTLGFNILTHLNPDRSLENSVPIFIHFCPFCGRKLHKFYKDDAYANEIYGVTIDFFTRKE